MAGALPRLLAHYGAGRLTLHVQGPDLVLRGLLTAGVEGEALPAAGTLRVLNFLQLLERCRPYLAERIGATAAGALEFSVDGPPGAPHGGFTIRSGGDAVRLPDLASLAVYLFGAPGPDGRRAAGLGRPGGRPWPRPSPCRRCGMASITSSTAGPATRQHPASTRRRAGRRCWWPSRAGRLRASRPSRRPGGAPGRPAPVVLGQDAYFRDFQEVPEAQRDAVWTANRPDAVHWEALLPTWRRSSEGRR